MAGQAQHRGELNIWANKKCKTHHGSSWLSWFFFCLLFLCRSGVRHGAWGL